MASKPIKNILMPGIVNFTFVIHSGDVYDLKLLINF